MYSTLIRNLLSFFLLIGVLSESCPADTFDVTPSPTPFFVPPYVSSGKDSDREFDGNGPKIRVDLKLKIKNQREIWTTVTMSAVETKKNWTTAKGSRDFLIYRHSEKLTRIVSKTTARYDYVDTDHDNDIFKSHGVVRQYEFVGDRKGDEAGIHTGVRVHFNPITVEGTRGKGEKPGTLRLKWMGVIDNGEGTGGLHGPYGNIHAQFYDSKSDEVRHIVIPGPSKKEWVDLDQKSYDKGLILHKWTALDETVSLKLWESDPGIGREHDTLYFMKIRRQDTTGKIYLGYDSRYPAASDVMDQIKKRNPPAWYKDKMKKSGLKRPPKLFVELVTE